jgi:serine/threonine protein kinase/tetratricopeptide (TPR) repeat protein
MTFRREDWSRVQEIFHAALERTGDARRAYLAAACAADEQLRAQVDALLASHDAANRFLDQPPTAVENLSRSDDDVTGRTTGPYRVMSRIGSGGMGDVYLAHDTRLDRPVALKLLSRHVIDDPEHLRRFRQEAKAVSSLNHPHILVIHDFGELESRPYIVTEFIEGHTLRDRLLAGPVDTSKAIDIAAQIASALGAAHERGIVHRDIKPENVMVRPDGYVKVLDFGLAKPVTPAEDVGTQTQPGTVIGTPRYMSPEHARGLPLDPRSDVWSLGVVLYEMIAGHPPFDGRTLADVLAAILASEPALLTETSPAVAACVSRALSKPVAARFANGRDMYAALMALKVGAAAAAADDIPAPGTGASSRKRSRRTINSIAVLPLAPASGGVDLEYLADGITESVINALSQLPTLKVMARSTVFRYKGRAIDVMAVGRELGVRAVLSGRLWPTADGFVVAAELVDAVDGSQIWGGQLQRHAADAFALQEETAAEIAAQLRPRLTSAERKRIVKRHTANPRAFEAHLKGRFHLAKRTLDGFTKAIAFFEQAIAEDRDYALAYAGLADCWTLLSAGAYGEPSARLMARAREVAEQALKLDPSNAEVQTALGFVRFRIDWDWEGAERAFGRACELSPGHAPAHHRLALLLSALGRHQEAYSEIRQAHELDPLSLIISTAVGRVLHFQRRYDEAIEQCRRTLDLDAAFVQAHLDLGMAYAAEGRHDEAIAEFEAVLAPDDPRSLMRAVFGNMCGRAGRTQQAEAILQDLERRYRRGEAASYDLALILVGLGRHSEALDWLERACDVRSGLLVFLKVEPMFDPIRDEPRFDALLQRLRLPP